MSERTVEEIEEEKRFVQRVMIRMEINRLLNTSPLLADRKRIEAKVDTLRTELASLQEPPAA